MEEGAQRIVRRIRLHEVFCQSHCPFQFDEESVRDAGCILFRCILSKNSNSWELDRCEQCNDFFPSGIMEVTVRDGGQGG